MAQCLRGGTPDEVAKLVLTASGGPFRGWIGRGPRGRHPRAGRSASHLVDGPDEHAELGVAGQQGPRTHRNPPAVRHRVRPHRGRGAPAVDRALDGHLHRRLDPRAGQPAGHEAADRAGAGLAGAGARRGAGLRLHHRVDLGVRAAGRGGLPGRRPGPARGRGRRLPDRGLQRRERRSGGRVPRRAASDSRPSCEPSPRCCALPTSGPPNPLPWKTYSMRNAGPATGRSAQSSGRFQEKDYSPHDVRARHRRCSRWASCCRWRCTNAATCGWRAPPG